MLEMNPQEKSQFVRLIMEVKVAGPRAPVRGWRYIPELVQSHHDQISSMASMLS